MLKAFLNIQDIAQCLGTNIIYFIPRFLHIKQLKNINILNTISITRYVQDIWIQKHICYIYSINTNASQRSQD